MQVGDKEERRHAILDAAERLLLRAPERIANMAEVAAEAGLAKGTIYLYFPSKEELLLALHERNIDSFFSALMTQLEGPGPIGFAEIIKLIRAHIVAPPLFLPLASRCFGAIDQQIPAEVSRTFKLRMDERFAHAGAGLDRHVPALRPGGGATLLRYSYALILGLWQMVGSKAQDEAAHVSQPPVAGWPYEDRLESALSALWQGRLMADAGR